MNVIGEIVLSQREAQRREEKYISILENPDIDYLSIKISNLYSQFVPHAHEENIEQLMARLERVYEAAMKNTFTNSDGKEESKFVNLDMEEYKDIEVTLDLFKRVLMKDKFKGLYAGIVIQNYLPDALGLIKDLYTFAKKRVQEGGAAIKIRIVKGANQEMEMTEASLRGWPLVTYSTKAQSDANFKLAMDYLLNPEVAPYVHTGVASHNLFDHALAMLLAKQRGVQKYVSTEMLEGMSEAAYKVLKQESLNVILYAPTATKETFTNAIAYLVRRFDENTAEQNFLRHSFGLRVDTPAWETLVKSYEESIEAMKSLDKRAYRTQDRNKEPIKPEIDLHAYQFKNENDTDFVLKENRVWAESIREKWINIGENGGFHAYPVVAGQTMKSGSDVVEVIDKSQYHKNVKVGSFVNASPEQMRLAIQTAKADPDKWRDKSIAQRQEILMNVAHEIRHLRGDLIGVAASLAAGNTVILKPASDAVLSAYVFCECFWRAGVSKNTLQFLPARGSDVGKHVISSDEIDFAIFTGGEESAYKILQTKPDIALSAETGGKDATIVTAMADRDQALKNVIVSAFHNSGQKCSATSLLVLEKELYDDEKFKHSLKEAVESLNTGSVWNFKNRVGSLSSLPSGNLKKSLSYLDKSEEWLVKPSYADNENPYLMKPSVRWGTSRGDFCHMNELFGPVLSVMRAENLEDAINIVNSTGYGLTSGIETLDEREIAYWKENIIAGNLYINRGTTGAIVMRQPFGGMRKSAIGSGKKAGGFNYVSQFMNIECSQMDTFESCSTEYLEQAKVFLNKESTFNKECDKAFAYACNFAYWHQEEFMREHDYAHIRGESNVIRYLGVKSVLLRLGEEYERIRFLSRENISTRVYEVASKSAKYIASAPFVAHGRVEMTHYFIEQSVTHSYHRYGNLGFQGLNLEKEL